jgi:hypothetical protein
MHIEEKKNSKKPELDLGIDDLKEKLSKLKKKKKGKVYRNWKRQLEAMEPR